MEPAALQFRSVGAGGLGFGGLRFRSLGGGGLGLNISRFLGLELRGLELPGMHGIQNLGFGLGFRVRVFFQIWAVRYSRPQGSQAKAGKTGAQCLSCRSEMY